MDLDGNTEIPLPSSTSRPTNTATKIVEQLKILIEHRKEWATKIGNAELALLNCNANEEKDLEKERDSLVKNKGILDNKIQCLKETLKMMKNVMEAEIKQQDIPGEKETGVNSKKRKKKKKRAESDLESSSAETHETYKQFALRMLHNIQQQQQRSNNQNNPNKKHKSNGYYGNNQPVVYQNKNPINGYQLQQLPAIFQQQQFQQQF
ncbi:MAG: hypothetical protein BYD32DRAFT_451821 [Podila humilis]|nr:MAG: hypothetical protein BYD32DRAFT_451821 [Podila humilis]